MLVVEQLISPHPHADPDDPTLHSVKRPTSTDYAIEFEAELGQLPREEGPQSENAQSNPTPALPTERSFLASGKAFTLTLGLIVHGLADGLALGVSFLPVDALNSGSSGQSFVVFLALLIHKG